MAPDNDSSVDKDRLLRGIVLVLSLTFLQIFRPTPPQIIALCLSIALALGSTMHKFIRLGSISDERGRRGIMILGVGVSLLAPLCLVFSTHATDREQANMNYNRSTMMQSLNQIDISYGTATGDKNRIDPHNGRRVSAWAWA